MQVLATLRASLTHLNYRYTQNSLSLSWAQFSAGSTSSPGPGRHAKEWHSSLPVLAHFSAMQKRAILFFPTKQKTFHGLQAEQKQNRRRNKQRQAEKKEQSDITVKAKEQLHAEALWLREMQINLEKWENNDMKSFWMLSSHHCVGCFCVRGQKERRPASCLHCRNINITDRPLSSPCKTPSPLLWWSICILMRRPTSTYSLSNPQ